MKHLSKRHKFELISLAPRGAAIEPAEFVERTDVISKEQYSKFTKLVRKLLYMLIGVPPSVSTSASSAMKKLVKSKFESGQFDAILLFEMGAIQYCPASSHHKLVVNVEDPESIKLSRIAELPIWSIWQRLKMYQLVGLTTLYENRILHKMAKVLLLSESDTQDMRGKFLHDNFTTMPYGVDKRDLTEIMAYADREKAIVFSGNMFHPSNIDGAIFLLNDIFPLIVQEYPAAILWIVGADPDNRIYEAAERFGDKVVITGRVTDIADYLKRATVSICPVRLKIGVQTKILEALSWGTPVVTTSAGNSGIKGVTGTHLWVEDAPQLLAKRVCDLLNGSDWSRMSAQGRELTTENFSWQGSAANLEQHLVSSIVPD